MANFIILSIIFTIIVGLLVGMCITGYSDNLKGLKRAVIAIAIAILTGVAITAMFYAEYKIDENMWNNGYCECGAEWHFSNVEHLKNNDEIYYWNCEECGQVIKLNTQFSK